MAEKKLTEAKLVRPSNEPTALRWKCSCGNADVQVFLGDKRTANVRLVLSAKCDACGESIGEIN